MAGSVHFCPARTSSSTCSSSVPVSWSPVQRPCLLEGGDGMERRCKEIVDLEMQADEITREVMLAVRKSFITSFDRGDIKDLIQSMDDAAIGEIAIISYKADVTRADGEPYLALVSSGYVRRDAAWKLAFQQHTPV